MTIIFWITGILIFCYLAYPFWLILFSDNHESEVETKEITSVSLILLLYNGKRYLLEKINFLIEELSCFKHYELIIIDDNSTDGSDEILKIFKGSDNINIILKPQHKGIPHSMNLGAGMAKYEYIIFCDQRQQLSPNILRRIVEPLKLKNAGAVSGCISHHDKENRLSLIRRYENFIKSKESNAGSLIGVYGPCYAIKKKCYQTIPENIILDDLFLSLRILKSRQIKLREDCQIFDDSISTLYNYQRTRRYLLGFLQILQEKTMFSELKIKHKIMLIWHKYLRILIPFFLFLSYFCMGIMIMYNLVYIIPFGIFTVMGLLSVLPVKVKYHFRLKTLIRMNIHCFIGLLDVLYTKVFYHKPETAIRSDR